MQTAWEIIVYTFGYLPLCAALYHPIETVAACFGLGALAIWMA